MIVLCDIDGTLVDTVKTAIELEKEGLIKNNNYIRNPKASFFWAFPPTRDDIVNLIKRSNKYANKKLVETLLKFDHVDFLTSRRSDVYTDTVEQLTELGFLNGRDTLLCVSSEVNKFLIITNILEANTNERVIVYDDNELIIRLLNLVKNKYPNLEINHVQLPEG